MGLTDWLAGRIARDARRDEDAARARRVGAETARTKGVGAGLVAWARESTGSTRNGRMRMSRTRCAECQREYVQRPDGRPNKHKRNGAGLPRRRAVRRLTHHDVRPDRAGDHHNPRGTDMGLFSRRTGNQPESAGTPVTGVWHADAQTLTYTCPSCKGGKVHRGEAFRGGVVERCGCGSDNDVTVR